MIEFSSKNQEKLNDFFKDVKRVKEEIQIMNKISILSEMEILDLISSEDCKKSLLEIAKKYGL